MNRKIAVLTLCAMLFALSSAKAQQTTKIPRIGFLYASSPSPDVRTGFLQGLHKFGYIEGQNITIEYRAAKGQFERLPVLAAELVRLNVKDIEPAFQEARKASAGGVLELGGPLLNVHQTALVNLAAKSRLPTMWVRRRFVEAGGLMYYGVDTADLNRRAAAYVDKILKGTKPAELPVEQPTKFEFVINLKAAKQIGLTIPPNVLARATRIIR
jgi:putative tryptophan/tyrosine transport system substrate-binding protein